jgi:peptidyl-prolyl cis-trans isomerase SurA
MVSRSGDDAVVRHILKIPQITQPEIDETAALLDSVRSQLIAGTLSFGAAIVQNTPIDDQQRSTAGQVMGRNGSTFLSISDLDKDMVLLLKGADLKPGQYSKPAVFTDERGKKGVRLVQLLSKTDPHRENLRDDYNRIALRALEEKRATALEKWFLSKIPTFYIMIDSEYRNCANLSKWQTAAPTAGN